MGMFFNKEAGINAKTITKEFLLPSAIIGPIIGAGVTAATSKDKKQFREEVGKGMVTGFIGDIATGAAIGLWNQRKNLSKK